MNNKNCAEFESKESEEDNSRQNLDVEELLRNLNDEQLSRMLRDSCQLQRLTDVRVQQQLADRDYHLRRLRAGKI